MRGRSFINITVRNEEGNLKDTFSTDAKPEDIRWVLAMCTNPDLIRKHDVKRVKTPIHWVSYHLRRNSWKVTAKKKDRPTYVVVVKPVISKYAKYES